MDDRRERASQNVFIPPRLGQPIPQQVEDAEPPPITDAGGASIEERFANWGTD